MSRSDVRDEYNVLTPGNDQPSLFGESTDQGREPYSDA